MSDQDIKSTRPAPIIKVLDDRVINRIAAGEVVERPASVVKELLENALDSGAEHVTLELEKGGRDLVRVVDDGCGMGRQDAIMCIERHATSKIRSDEDLEGINTMGFRGEALPSIASVSRFELATRPRGSNEGTMVVVDGGRLSTVETMGMPEGTRVTVRDLFFNVPARRGFLRTAGTEYSHCVDVFTRIALVHPEVDFTLVHNGRQAIRAVKGETPARRVAGLLGPAGESLRPVGFSRDQIEVRGFASPVGVHRQGGQAASHLYVNRRFVKDPVLRKAVSEAYKGLVPLGRYPVVVLEVTLPPGKVDVNVHPAKVEVRFRDPGNVLSAVASGLREALREHGLHPPTPRNPPLRSPQAPTTPQSQPTLPLSSANRAPPPMAAEPHPRPAPSPPRPPAAEPHPGPAPSPPQPPAANEPRPRPSRSEPTRHEPRDGLLPVATFRDLKIIGQHDLTYIVCEGAGELVIIDQHAAHERITLHRLMRQRREGRDGSQILLTPAVVELPPSSHAALSPHLDILTSVGFEVEPFDGRTIAIKAVPPALAAVDPVTLLQDLADDLAEGGRGGSVEDVLDRMLSSLACHTSVRARQPLSTWEMRAILGDLDQVDFSVCAHGRPVAIRIGAREIQGRFHRT